MWDHRQHQANMSRIGRPQQHSITISKMDASTFSSRKRRSVELDCATVMIPTFHTSGYPQHILDTSNFGCIHQ
jgi:hypothetical protein